MKGVLIVLWALVAICIAEAPSNVFAFKCYEKPTKCSEQGFKQCTFYVENHPLDYNFLSQYKFNELQRGQRIDIYDEIYENGVCHEVDATFTCIYTNPHIVDEIQLICMAKRKLQLWRIDSLFNRV